MQITFPKWLNMLMREKYRWIILSPANQPVSQWTSLSVKDICVICNDIWRRILWRKESLGALMDPVLCGTSAHNSFSTSGNCLVEYTAHGIFLLFSFCRNNSLMNQTKFPPESWIKSPKANSGMYRNSLRL